MAKDKRTKKTQTAASRGPATTAAATTAAARATPADSGAPRTRSRRPVTGRRRGNALPWIIGLVGIGLLVAVQIGVNVAREARLPGERFASQGNVHVALGSSTPPYNSDPPTSGWHTAELAPWGSHLEVQHDQRLVHNMEDGGVILWYANGTLEENREHVAALEAVVPRSYPRVVIAPRDGMPTTYAATAWQRLQRFETIDADAMQAFIAAYHGIDNHR
jgi:hypothetical protein